MNNALYCTREMREKIENGWEVLLGVGGYKILVIFEPGEFAWSYGMDLELFEEIMRDVILESAEKVEVDCMIKVGGAEELKGIVEEKSYFFESFSWDWQSRVVSVHSGNGVANLMRVIRQVMLKLTYASKAGLALHASSVENDGEAWLFLAESGGGKSTTAQALTREGLRLISDDSTFLKKEKEEWILYSSGWPERNMGPCTGKWRKQLYFVVKKTDKFSLNKIDDVAKKIGVIMQQVWLLDDRDKKDIFGRVCEFAQDIELYELGLSLGEKNIIERIMNEKS